ncbi:MAG: FkbM family methyltransferase [Patescibacteria group bacterium]|nr:FkbM family methyltransferase [Patescibacteria group bacterium]
MLQLLKNLYATYRKKLLIKWPYYFDKLRGKKIFKTKDLKFYADKPYHNHIARALKKDKYEDEVTKEWLKELPGKKCIFDIGGFNGYFGLIAAVKNPEAKVFIFEPDPINARHIEKNIEINNLKNAKLIQAAVSDKQGELVFGGASGGTGAKIGKGEQKVKAITLDDFIKQENSSPDLIKMDIEGAETLAIKGAKSLLEETQNLTIILEVHFDFLKEFGSSEEELFSLINQGGDFACEDLEDRNKATYHVKLKKCYQQEKQT